MRSTTALGLGLTALFLPLLAVTPNLFLAGAVLWLSTVSYVFTINPASSELGDAVDRRGSSSYSVVCAVYNLAYALGMIGVDSYIKFATDSAHHLQLLQILLIVSGLFILCLPMFLIKPKQHLERYYRQYRVYGTKEPKTRRIRYFGLQVAGAATGLASQIGFDKLFYRQRRNFDLGQDALGKNALKVGIVAIALDGGSSLTELSSNTCLAMKNIREKKSPGAAVKEVISRVNQLLRLPAQVFHCF